jgi:hypothetical protein
MYSRITSSDNEKGLLKPVGPYRFHSSGNSIASVQSSGVFGPIGTITIAPHSVSYTRGAGKGVKAFKTGRLQNAHEEK